MIIFHVLIVLIIVYHLQKTRLGHDVYLLGLLIKSKLVVQIIKLDITISSTTKRRDVASS